MTNSKEKEANRVAMWLTVIVTVIVFGVPVAFVVSSCSEFGSINKAIEERKAEPCTLELRKTGAWLESRDAVKRQLKSPGTADFPWGDYRVARTSGADNSRTCDFEVRSYVDAQNSFGAMLRTHFTVALRYQNGHWFVKSVRFAE